MPCARLRAWLLLALAALLAVTMRISVADVPGNGRLPSTGGVASAQEASEVVARLKQAEMEGGDIDGPLAALLPAGATFLDEVDVSDVKHVLMRAVKSRFKDKNYAGAAKAARMFEALQNSRNSAPPLMDWGGEPITLVEDLFGTPAAPRDPHLAEPLMSAMMIYYRALGDSYRDEEAQAAAVLYVLTWRSLASRKSRDAQKYFAIFMDRTEEDTIWPLQTLSNRLDEAGWHDQAAAMTAIYANMLQEHLYYVSDIHLDRLEERFPKARDPDVAMDCYRAWIAIDWEFAENYHGGVEGDLPSEALSHLCSMASSPASRMWCRLLKGEYPEDAAAVQQVLRDAANENDCLLVTYLWQKRRWVDVDAFRACSRSSIFKYFASYMLPRDSGDKLAFHVMLAFVGGKEWDLEKFMRTNGSTASTYQAHYVDTESGIGTAWEEVVRAIESLQWLGGSNNDKLAEALVKALSIFATHSPYRQCVMEWCERLGFAGLPPLPDMTF